MVEQSAVAICPGFAVVGKGVGVGAGQFTEQSVERRGMTQLVLGERTHRDVLLEERRDPGPFRIGEPDDELVIGHRAEQLGEGSRRRRGRGSHGRATAGLIRPDPSSALRAWESPSKCRNGDAASSIGPSMLVGGCQAPFGRPGPSTRRSDRIRLAGGDCHPPAPRAGTVIARLIRSAPSASIARSVPARPPACRA